MLLKHYLVKQINLTCNNINKVTKKTNFSENKFCDKIIFRFFNCKAVYLSTGISQANINTELLRAVQLTPVSFGIIITCLK